MRKLKMSVISGATLYVNHSKLSKIRLPTTSLKERKIICYRVAERELAFTVFVAVAVDWCCCHNIFDISLHLLFFRTGCNQVRTIPICQTLKKVFLQFLFNF